MNDVQLVRHILEAEGIAPADLAAHLGVKKRAMRDRIRRANDSMASAAQIVYDRSRGLYVVAVADEEAFEHWLAGRPGGDAFGHLPSTPEERVAYLLQDLLSRTDWITLEDLASLLYVSRSTISSDLRQLAIILDRFDLEIEKRPRYGIRVRGEEMNRRLCLASVAIDTRLDEDELAGSVSTTMLDAVGTCLSEVLERASYKINPVSHQNLVVHIAIALARISKGCYVPMEPANLAQVRGSREYAVATEVARAIEDAFRVDLPEEEVAYIAIHLASKHLVEGVPAEGAAIGEADDAASGLEVSDEAWNLAADMVEVVWRAFRFDFRNDVELRMNLARHIMPLLVRLTYGMTLANPLLPDIKARYPLPFSMAADAMSLVAERYQAEASEDEVGYIALIFALALERAKTDRPRRRALVVCASGAGSARLLAYRLQREFEHDFESVVACDASEFAEVDLAGIDYIFTTVSLDRHVDVPVVRVALFLDDTSYSDVKQALRRDAASDARRYVVPELFFPHLALASREEVIAFLCARCAEAVDLPETFEELVWVRERAGATSFGNLVALPHPIEAVSPCTFAAVALLDAPIDWGGTPVQAVFLVCVARDADGDLEGFYRSMTSVLTSQQAIQRLVDAMSFDVLLNELEGA